MLKSLVQHERIETTVPKAKELRRHADKLITLAKNNTIANKRRVVAKLMINYNRLTPKESRRAKQGDTSFYNADRKVIGKLFSDLAGRFENRHGGYTRITRKENRVGDDAEKCYIEFVQ
jgi:large subunit ribosomal protein L17